MENIRRVQLSEIAEFITKGTTPTTLGYEFQEEGVNFLKIECFDENGDFVESKATHISNECHERLKRSQLKSGDILFSIAGVIGRVASVTEDMLPANTNQALAIIRISDEQVYLPYVKLILTSPIVIEQFEKKKQGVAQLNLSLKDISEFSIPLPSKKEQIELAELFTKIINVISKRKEELKALDDIIKARFVEMFVKNEYDWKEVTIAEVCIDMRTGPFGSSLHHDEFVDKGVFVLGIDNAVENTFSYNRMRYITEEKYEKLKRYTVYPGDVIITIMGTVGKAAVIPKNMPKAINTKHLACLTPNTEIVDSYFLVNAFQIHPLIRHQLESQCKGAIMDGLNLTIIKGLKFKLPPIKLQRKFVEFYNQVNKSKVAVQKALDETQKLFDSLMQQYFG